MESEKNKRLSTDVGGTRQWRERELPDRAAWEGDYKGMIRQVDGKATEREMSESEALYPPFVP